MSGRRRAQVFEDARLLGQSSFIYEAGACVVLDGEEHWLTGELMPGELTIAEQIERSGAPALLLERYAGRLEYHEPWHTEREVSHLFRGLVDALEVDRRWPSTATRICGWSTTAPSAAARRRSPSCRTCAATTSCRRAPPRPARSPFTAAPAATRARRPSPSATRARISPAPPHVDAFWLVANAVERDPPMRGGGRRLRQRAHRRGRARAGGVRGGAQQAGGPMMPARFSSS